MKNNNFINHEDPTRSFEPDLKNIDLKEQYSKLTENEKLMIFLKINGYTHCPPTVERLYSDEYYLGGEKFFSHGDLIFPYWKETLGEISPSPVLTRYPLLALGGAIN